MFKFLKNKKNEIKSDFVIVDAYVRNQLLMSLDEAIELTLRLNANPITYWGVEPPQEPVIGAIQFDDLPDHLKACFDKTSLSLKRR